MLILNGNGKSIRPKQGACSNLVTRLIVCSGMGGALSGEMSTSLSSNQVSGSPLLLLIAASFTTVSEGTIMFSENFDSMPLGPNWEEGISTGSGGQQTKVWTKVAPAGWTVDDSLMQGLGNPATNGVMEWAGSFTDPKWWAETAGNQNRSSLVLL